jgi:hypothetical protein
MKTSLQALTKTNDFRSPAFPALIDGNWESAFLLACRESEVRYLVAPPASEPKRKKSPVKPKP